MAATAAKTNKEKKPFNLVKWAKSRQGQQLIIGIAFMIIPLLLLFTFTYLPFGEMIKFSFYKMKYSTPVESRQFVGLKTILMYSGEMIVSAL